MAVAARRQDLEDAHVRRFDLADLTYHGPWLFKRLPTAFPHLKDVQIGGWLRGLIDSNNFLFLRSENAVGLAEMIHEQMAPAPVIRERFVLCRDPDKHGEEAALLYADFLRWARSMGATAIEVEVHTDVPHDLIRTALGLRLFKVERIFAKVS